MDVVLAVALLVALDVVTLGLGFHLLGTAPAGSLRPRQVWLLSLVGFVGLPVLLAWRLSHGPAAAAGARPR